MVINTRRGEMFKALRHRNFRLYVAGMGVSLAGTWMQQLAQAWLVYRLTRSEWILGLTWFFANIPVLLLGPVAGLAADRFPRRRVILVTQTAAMLQAIVLAALTLTGHIRVWHIVTLAAVLGVSNAFDIPARQAFFIRLVGKDDLLNAISLNSATFNSARVVGPSLAGFVIARLGEGVCFSLNAVSFTAVLGSLLLMDVKEEASPPSTESEWQRLRSGLALAWRTSDLRTMLLVCGGISLATAPAMTLAPVFAEGIFHRGSQGLGFLTGAMGLGAIVGTLSLARGRATAQLPSVIFTSCATLAATFTLYAVSPSYWLCLALMPFVGMAVMRYNAATNTAIQVTIPDDYRGRVMALYSMMVVGMFPIGSLLCGAIAARIGARGAVFAGALGALAAAVTVYRRRNSWVRWLSE